MAFGVEGDRVRLVPMTVERHQENYYRWFNDLELTDTLTIGYFPMSHIQAGDMLKHFLRPDEKNIHWAIETLDGRIIGHSGIQLMSMRHGTGLTGSFIAAPEDRGKGYGTEAAELRSRYAFETLGLRMLYSQYLAGNDGSLRMQTKSGYKVWGAKPKAIWKNGQHVDLMQTYLSKEDWLARQK